MATIDDRYELIDVIGSGGMATVWRARDLELDRLVAVKRPHPAAEGDPTHARFRREARTAATVTHPNLVTVHDVGADDDGPYLVMEYVDAPSLDNRPFGEVDALRIGREIASGLAALHSVGIVHRDVKPGNIMLAPNGAQLTDFGIARSLDEASTMTQAGQTFATPAYAAPEVLAHGAHTEASDVYSLGAVLLELVTGQRISPTTDTRILVTDPSWQPILDAALAAEPGDRPPAAELERRLRRAEPSPEARVETSVLPVASPPPAESPSGPSVAGSTTPPDDRIVTSVQPIADRRPTPDDRRRRRLVGFLAIAGAVCLLLIGVAVIGSRDDGEAVTPALSTTADEAPPAPADPLVVDTRPATDTAQDVGTAPPADSAAPATPPATSPATAPPPTTAAPEVVDALASIDQARRRLTDFIEEIRDETISGKEADRLLDEIATGMAAVNDDDRRAVDKEFRAAAERIDKRIDDGGDRALAETLLFELLDRLGVDPLDF